MTCTRSINSSAGICRILKKARLFSIVLISLPSTRILKNGLQSGDLRVEGRNVIVLITSITHALLGDAIAFANF